MEEVFKQCYGCFGAPLFPKCRRSRRAMQNKWRDGIIVVFYFGSSAVRDYFWLFPGSPFIDELEAAGIVGPFTGSKARNVLVGETYLEDIDTDQLD